jgi:glyoxylase-like metal-dependent hydrolase (beta-lactamase superfamily II)
MQKIKLEVGNIGTNCYIIYCEDTHKAAVIDPGGNHEEILSIIESEKLDVEYIINTHGHADHIAANGKIKQATRANILIHADDEDMLTDAQKNLSLFMGKEILSPPADHLLHNNEQISIGNITLEIMHTPGHTPGGICLKYGNTVFSGDTLFSESIGRTDFPGGSYSQLINSVKNKLMILPDDVIILPGHGPDTNIGWERKYNPFIQQNG